MSDFSEREGRRLLSSPHWGCAVPTGTLHGADPGPVSFPVRFPGLSSSSSGLGVSRSHWGREASQEALASFPSCRVFWPPSPGHLDSALIPAFVVPTSIRVFYIFTKLVEASWLQPKEGDYLSAPGVVSPPRDGDVYFRLFPSTTHVPPCVRFPRGTVGSHSPFYGSEIPAGRI